jgi:hypothetical protein
MLADPGVLDNDAHGPTGWLGQHRAVQDMLQGGGLQEACFVPNCMVACQVLGRRGHRESVRYGPKMGQTLR